MPRKVVASTYLTLDGFIDEPGRWSFPFWSEEASRFKAHELFASEAGRSAPFSLAGRGP